MKHNVDFYPKKIITAYAKREEVTYFICNIVKFFIVEFFFYPKPCEKSFVFTLLLKQKGVFNHKCTIIKHRNKGFKLDK